MRLNWRIAIMCAVISALALPVFADDKSGRPYNDPPLVQGQGGYYDPSDRSGPYAVDTNGNKKLINGAFGGAPAASVQRAGNTTTYTPNTGWCNTISSCTTLFNFTNACRVNGGLVLAPTIDIWSSANPTTKLQGMLWLFNSTPTIINDNAPFNISADIAKVMGSMQGFGFTLGNTQNAAATVSAVTIQGVNSASPLQCPPGSTTIQGMVQVVNAYVPANGETLSARLNTVGTN